MNTSFSSVKSDLRVIATGSSLAFGGAILGNGFTYLYGLVIARLLGAESVGLYFLALVLIQIISAVCRIGLPEGVLRYIAIYISQDDLPRVRGTILSAIYLVTATNSVAALLLYLLAEPISIYLLRQPDLTLYIRWFAVILPIFSLFVIITNIIQALKQMEIVVFIRDIVQPITMLFCASVLFVFIWGTIHSFLAAHLVSMMIGLISSLYFLKQMFPIFSRKSSPIFEWRTLLAFSLPITIGDLAFYLFRWSDTFFLSFFTSLREVGIYNAALRTTLLLNLLAVSFNALYAPIIADHHHYGRHQELEMILKTLVRWCLSLALPLVLIIGLLAEEILLLWGPEFERGSSILVILALSQLLFLISSLLAFTLLMSGKQYLESGNVILVTFLNIVLNMVLIPRHGLIGAAQAMLVSQGVALTIRLAEVRYYMNIWIYSPTFLKPFIALIPVSILVFIFLNYLAPFPDSNLSIVTITSFLIVTGYLATLYLLGFEQEDVRLWKEIRTKALPVSR